MKLILIKTGLLGIYKSAGFTDADNIITLTLQIIILVMKNLSSKQRNQIFNKTKVGKD